MLIMPKIVFVCAGSVVFTKNLLGDILTFPELQNGTISLCDYAIAGTLGVDTALSALTHRTGIVAVKLGARGAWLPAPPSESERRRFRSPSSIQQGRMTPLTQGSCTASYRVKSLLKPFGQGSSAARSRRKPPGHRVTANPGRGAGSAAADDAARPYSESRVTRMCIPYHDGSG